MSHVAELRDRLETGIRELEEDIDRLRAALAALEGGPARRPVRPSRPPSPAEGVEVVPAGKLVALLSGEPAEGLTTSELARQTGGAPDQVLALLKELERDGQVHRSGVRRSTGWHAGGAVAPAEPEVAEREVAEPEVAESSEVVADEPGAPAEAGAQAA